MPYISSSIILQLLTVVIPALEKLAKENKLSKKEFAMPLGFKFNVWLEERIKSRGGRISKTNLDLLAMLLGKGMEQKEKRSFDIELFQCFTNDTVAIGKLMFRKNQTELFFGRIGAGYRSVSVLIFVGIFIGNSLRLFC